MKNKLIIDWDDFLKNYWQKKPVVLRKAFADFHDPITPNELAGLALESEIESRIVTNKDGKWDAQYGPFESYDHLGKTNWSLLVQAVDHWHESAATLIEPFRVLPHWQFEDLMISYATPQAGVGPHIDNYDVFITQGMGKRRWIVGDRNPEYRQYSAHPALLHVEEYSPIIDVELNPGDILYLPIGYPHNGISLTESLSYSVGFRTPTSQDMLSHFTDYVLDNVPNGIFYQDPNLQLSTTPYQIHDNEIEKLKTQLCQLITDPNLFNDWFGKYITQPMHELNIIPLDPPYTLQELQKDIACGVQLYRVPSVRIFKLGKKGFIHGRVIPLEESYIDLLCQKEVLTTDDLQDITLLSGLLDLVNEGFWYVE